MQTTDTCAEVAKLHSFAHTVQKLLKGIFCDGKLTSVCCHGYAEPRVPRDGANQWDENSYNLKEFVFESIWKIYHTG